MRLKKTSASWLLFVFVFVSFDFVRLRFLNARYLSRQCFKRLFSLVDMHSSVKVYLLSAIENTVFVHENACVEHWKQFQRKRLPTASGVDGSENGAPGVQR